MADELREKKLPEGRLSRLSRMAGVGLRAGAGLLLRDDSNGDASARHAVEVLGQLRGLAAKIGQMAGYVDGLVPSGQRDAWQTALSALQAAAPTSNPDVVRRFVEEELGAPIDRLYASWDRDPIASASIGQVHRATLGDGAGALAGLEVAVKVQHPGIAAAIESDLKNAGMLESMAGALGGRRVNSAEVLQAVRDRFREELDYGLEAERMELFRRVSAHDDRVRIPRVVASHSTKRVLSTEFVRGLSFEAATRAPEPERAAWAETLWRFIFRSNLVGAHFNADPHPGNYFFHDGGAVTFIDFGCVNPISPRQLALAHHIHRAALEGDEAHFRAGVRALMPTKAGRLEGPAIDYMRIAFAPVFESPFRMTRAYAASLVDEMKGLAKIALKTPAAELFQMPPDMVFMNRLQFGFYSVLARLDVSVDYRGIERGFWPEVVRAHGVPPLRGAENPLMSSEAGMP